MDCIDPQNTNSNVARMDNIIYCLNFHIYSSSKPRKKCRLNDRNSPKDHLKMMLPRFNIVRRSITILIIYVSYYYYLKITMQYLNSLYLSNPYSFGTKICNGKYFLFIYKV